jgi:hypothetical protein
MARILPLIDAAPQFSLYRQTRLQKVSCDVGAVGAYGSWVTGRGIDVVGMPGMPSVGTELAWRILSLATRQTRLAACAKMSLSEGKVGTTTTEEMPPTHFPMTEDEALSRCSFSIAAALSRSNPVRLPSAAASPTLHLPNAGPTAIDAKSSAPKIWIIFMTLSPLTIDVV